MQANICDFDAYATPVFFCPCDLAIRRNRSQSSIGFQKSITFESSSGNGIPDQTPRAACRAADVQGGNRSYETCDVTTIIAFRPQALRTAISFALGRAPPDPKPHAWRIIFLDIRGFNEIRDHQIGLPGARPGKPVPR
jgi:hypothetical protein